MALTLACASTSGLVSDEEPHREMDRFSWCWVHIFRRAAPHQPSRGLTAPPPAGAAGRSQVSSRGFPPRGGSPGRRRPGTIEGWNRQKRRRPAHPGPARVPTEAHWDPSSVDSLSRSLRAVKNHPFPAEAGRDLHPRSVVRPVRTIAGGPFRLTTNTVSGCPRVTTACVGASTIHRSPVGNPDQPNIPASSSGDPEIDPPIKGPRDVIDAGTTSTNRPSHFGLGRSESSRACVPHLHRGGIALPGWRPRTRAHRGRKWSSGWPRRRSPGRRRVRERRSPGFTRLSTTMPQMGCAPRNSGEVRGFPFTWARAASHRGVGALLTGGRGVERLPGCGALRKERLNAGEKLAGLNLDHLRRRGMRFRGRQLRFFHSSESAPPGRSPAATFLSRLHMHRLHPTHHLGDDIHLVSGSGRDPVKLPIPAVVGPQ